ncbi:hypothetical protein AGMMS4957_16810 [Bacteroidia bacterium]|nr:hypothetical protein AGMMS4957_16810 [Bacteroidia bacterium]
MACITALVELRKQLTTDEHNRNAHYALLSDGDDNTFSNEKESSEEKRDGKIPPFDDILKIDIFNYLGTIELGALMVKRELIDIQTFYNQMGYRVENIFADKTVAQQTIKKHVQDEKKYYKNLNWIYEEIKKMDE